MTVLWHNPFLQYVPSHNPTSISDINIQSNSDLSQMYFQFISNKLFDQSGIRILSLRQAQLEPGLSQGSAFMSLSGFWTIFWKQLKCTIIAVAATAPIPWSYSSVTALGQWTQWNPSCFFCFFEAESHSRQNSRNQYIGVSISGTN